MALRLIFFPFEFRLVSAFVDDFRTFVESVGTVRNSNLVFFFQAELAYAVSIVVGWGVASYFSVDGSSIRRFYISKYVLIIRWRLLYVG